MAMRVMTWHGGVHMVSDAAKAPPAVAAAMTTDTTRVGQGIESGAGAVTSMVGGAMESARVEAAVVQSAAWAVAGFMGRRPSSARGMSSSGCKAEANRRRSPEGDPQCMTPVAMAAAAAKRAAGAAAAAASGGMAAAARRCGNAPQSANPAAAAAAANGGMAAAAHHHKAGGAAAHLPAHEGPRHRLVRPRSAAIAPRRQLQQHRQRPGPQHQRRQRTARPSYGE